MVEPSDGLVILYNYLWAREYDRHEQSGRKARPACVQIMIARAARAGQSSRSSQSRVSPTERRSKFRKSRPAALV